LGIILSEVYHVTVTAGFAATKRNELTYMNYFSKTPVFFSLVEHYKCERKFDKNFGIHRWVALYSGNLEISPTSVQRAKERGNFFLFFFFFFFT
jgi:hypothetical protein